MSDKFERPRGTRDFRPEEMAKRRWLEATFRDTFRRYGYREIQTPTFEHTALFEAKSGPNVVDEIYAFKDKAGRDVCLRPELTAPVMRFYVNELSHEPKPLKVYYHGPCYRYEEPQEGRYREFWQFGLELIGPEGPNADAEAISVAWQALRDAGLRQFTTHVGHIGVLRALTDALDAPDNKKAELYRKIDKDDAELDTFLDDITTDAKLAAAIVMLARHGRELELGDETASGEYFAQARAALDGRAPAEATARIEKALQDLEQTARLLHAQGIERAHLDLGVARGLDYYTGTVFEFHATSLGSQSQIGGGGAYTLAELFGGEHVGTTGFGLGFDRILLALEREGQVPQPARAADVYIAILGNAREEALRIAQRLRAARVATDADLMGRGLGKALQYADKIGAKLALIVGEKDLAQGTVTLRDLATGAQDVVKLGDVEDAVRAKLA